MSEDIEARLDSLEGDIQQLINERESYRKQVLGPRLEALEARSDDAQDTRAELQANLDAAWDRIERLEAELDSLVGLAEGEQGGPMKRAVDLRQGLIREARNTGGDDDTTATMHYQEVKQFLAQTGHGDVSKPDCYKAMSWAAGEDGDLNASPAFWLADEKRRLNGRDVRAICVDVADLPSSGGVGGGRSPTTAEHGNTEVSSPN